MTNRLSVYWSEDTLDAMETAVSLALHDGMSEPAEPPATLSFAEWAPRIRAQRAARVCPCRKVGSLCSVCAERKAQ